MIIEQKINEVKKLIRKGVPPGKLRATLAIEGYFNEDIEKCFEVKQFDLRSWYLVSAFILLLIGCWTFYYDKGILVLIFSTAMFVKYYLAEKKYKSNTDA